MSDGLSDLLDDPTTSPDGSGQSDGGKLRKQLETVLEQNKALQERLAKADQAERARALDGLFGKHSIPALARDFFPADSEVTDEVATAFVEKYGQLWGASATVATTPPAEQAAATAAQQFASQAGQAPVVPFSEDDYRAKFAQAKSPEELATLVDQLSALGA